MTAGAAAAGAAAAPQQLVGAEQQLTLAWQHFGAEAQQVGAGLQQVAATAWQHGAGAGAAAWQQEVCWWQHLTLGCLQQRTLAGLQQSRASAAPLKAARTANVAHNVTNFRTRLMVVSLFNFRWSGRFGLCHHDERVIPSWQHCSRRSASDTPWTQGDTQHCGSDKLFRLRNLWGVG